ncbi:MAG: hypothetical protein QN174_07800 [Armatimonadota bacterium]|nr:hypothetical protein [Armatimonadota bacterium]
MPTPPSTDNYQVGGVQIILGGVDLGNIAGFGIDPSDLEVLQHFTARSGARKVDKEIVVQKRLRFRATLDEHAKENYAKYFMGSISGSEVHPLTDPLAESNCVITYRNEAGEIWTYSHTRVSVKPAGAMDMGEFDDWVDFEIELESLQDDAQAPARHGRFTFA